MEIPKTKQITLQVTVADIEVILAGLSKMEAGISFNAIVLVKSQAEEQLKKIEAEMLKAQSVQMADDAGKNKNGKLKKV